MLRADLVRRTASEVIRTHRGNPLEFMLENEYANRARGDHKTADAWFDVAVAAAEMLREPRWP